ncbi:unnamed protein product [marine sediment metagenome]|uniref:Uncharacterized protein n=1 Tax=marine sediment metagenome TaxID=412755 RepID=X1S0K5_9ZZZZ
MKLHLPVRYLEKIDYPTLAHVRLYTETYRIEYMDRENPDKGWHKFWHSRQVEVLTIGGMNDYFLVYAYPPAGVETAKPEDVLLYELWRGWILWRISYHPFYYLDCATYREGEAAFKRRKAELGY